MKHVKNFKLRNLHFSKRFYYFGTIFFIIAFLLLQKQSIIFNVDATQISKKFGRLPESFSKGGYCFNKTTRGSIFYIKIQKTGSSTIKSSLLNYALKHELMICQDSTDLYHMNFPYAIDETKLIKSHKGKCQVVADELRFDHNQVSILMEENPVVIASVRDPVKHFISLYKFARIHEAVQLLSLLKLDFWDGIRIFLKNTELVRSVYNTLNEDDFPNHGMLAHLIRPSLQSFSLGLNPEATEKDVYKKTDRIDFFIVAENFFESMVLLARLLCCSYEDLVFVRQNIQKSVPEEKDEIPEDVLKMIKSYNRVDFILYNVAKNKLLHLTNSIDIDLEVRHYKDVIKHYSSQCEITRVRLAKIEGNYCLPEEASFFYQFVREMYKKRMLESLQNQYEKLNS